MLLRRKAPRGVTVTDVSVVDRYLLEDEAEDLVPL